MGTIHVGREIAFNIRLDRFDELFYEIAFFVVQQAMDFVRRTGEQNRYFLRVLRQCYIGAFKDLLGTGKEGGLRAYRSIRLRD